MNAASDSVLNHQPFSPSQVQAGASLPTKRPARREYGVITPRKAADPCLASILEYGSHFSSRITSQEDYDMERVPLHISLYLRSVVSNAAGRDAVARLRGRQAQDMVSVMQLVRLNACNFGGILTFHHSGYPPSPIKTTVAVVSYLLCSSCRSLAVHCLEPCSYAA